MGMRANVSDPDDPKGGMRLTLPRVTTKHHTPRRIPTRPLRGWAILLCALVAVPSLAHAAVTSAPFLAWHIEDTGPMERYSLGPSVAVSHGNIPYISAQRIDASTVTALVKWKSGTLWSTKDLRANSGGAGIGFGPDGVAQTIYKDPDCNVYYARSDTTWAEESVGHACFPELVVDSQSVPHVVAWANQGVVWATRTGASSWTPETITSQGQVTRAAAIGPGDVPYVLTSDNTVLTLYVWKKVSGAWSSTTVPDCERSGAEDIAIDADSGIHIVCSTASGLGYVRFQAGVWSTTIVRGQVEEASIGVDQTKNPYIAIVFGDATGVHVGLLSNGSNGWIQETVDPSRQVQRIESLEMTIDAHGKPRLVYSIFSTAGIEAGLPVNVLGRLRYAEPMSAFVDSLVPGGLP